MIVGWFLVGDFLSNGDAQLCWRSCHSFFSSSRHAVEMGASFLFLEDIRLLRPPLCYESRSACLHVVSGDERHIPSL